MRGKAVHAFGPSAWPMHGFNPFSGQAKRQVETADTGLIVRRGMLKKFLKRRKGFKLTQLLQLNCAKLQCTHGHHDGFALAGAA